jgi:hypothetical protein
MASPEPLGEVGYGGEGKGFGGDEDGDDDDDGRDTSQLFMSPNVPRMSSLESVQLGDNPSDHEHFQRSATDDTSDDGGLGDEGEEFDPSNNKTNKLNKFGFKIAGSSGTTVGSGDNDGGVFDELAAHLSETKLELAQV